jgi:hypothetical protein
MTTLTVIIARFAENLEWVHQIKDSVCVKSIIIFNKGSDDIRTLDPHPKIRIVKSENHGREGGTYLDYIIRNYDTLPKNIIFTQGDPLEHNEHFLHFFDEHTLPKYINKNVCPMTTQWMARQNIPPQKYVAHNNSYDSGQLRYIQYYANSANLQICSHSSFIDAGIVHVGETFKQKYDTGHILKYVCATLDIPAPKTIIPICLCACFFVKKKNILRHPKSVYVKLRTFLYGSTKQGGTEGYVLERLWQYLFTGNSYDTVHETVAELVRRCDSNISVYCDNRKTIWHKQVHQCSELIENPDTYLKYTVNNETKMLPGIDFIGRDTSVEPCSSLEHYLYRDRFIGAHALIKVFCNRRKHMWYKNVNHCSAIIKNEHTCIIFLKDGQVQWLVGVEYVGKELHSVQCFDLQTAIDTF